MSEPKTVRPKPQTDIERLKAAMPPKDKQLMAIWMILLANESKLTVPPFAENVFNKIKALREKYTQ